MDTEELENYYYSEIASTTIDILKKNGSLMPVSAISDLGGKIHIPITDRERDYNIYDEETEFKAVEFDSIAVIETIQKFPQELRLYGKLVGLVQWEREFWFNQIIDLLEEVGEPIYIRDIFKNNNIKILYKLKFSEDLNFHYAEEEILELIITFKNIFYKVLDEKSIKGLMTFFSTFKVGLNEWRGQSVELLNEIIEISSKSKNKIKFDRLLYKINNRGKFFKSDFSDLSTNELKDFLKNKTDHFNIVDDQIELLNSAKE
jgi:predicted transcriptional regulator